MMPYRPATSGFAARLKLDADAIERLNEASA
jgi:hypothetical protein